jgi:nicotinamidase-related amidase
MTANRNKKILKRSDTLLLVIDVQERILKVIREYEKMIENIIKLVKGAKTLNVPVVFTEQYPKGLGPTTRLLKEEVEGYDLIEKMSFSCYGAGVTVDDYSAGETPPSGALFEYLQSNEIKQIVVCGIESHVCVQQTVLDLLENGYQVNLVADAVSSRKKIDYETALLRMASNGAEVTTTESVLFELLNICGTPEFKAISKLVK